MKPIFFIIPLAVLLFFAGDCNKLTDPPPPVQAKTWHWSVDTLVYDWLGAPPDQVQLLSVWGSSPHDVWAAGQSDVVFGELWHYNGVRWRPVKDWPFSGIDSGGSYINDVYCVAGFDSTNVFVFGIHGYDTTGSDLVLKWDGRKWGTVPWKEGKAPFGGLGYGVAQNKTKLWAMSTTGHAVKYENGFLSVEPTITGYRSTGPTIAALNNGDVYVNAVRDSVLVERPQGTRTQLFKRDIGGTWTMVEDKFMAGGDYDGNGLGRGIWGVGDVLFANNRGFWRRIGSGWERLTTMSNVGGVCFTNQNDWWAYFNRDIWHYDQNGWAAVNVDILNKYPNHFLGGNGWSDGNEIFISLSNDGRENFMLHGKLL